MYAVILAGGGGTRLWPLSRPERPKPFLPLLGDETLLQRSVARLAPLVAGEDVYVVTDRRYAPLVADQLPGVPAANVLGEPVGRNTAAAVALAAEGIERAADEVMLVLPADGHIRDEAGFREALEAAARLAADGSLWTLGVKPSGPETGYGYVLAGGEPVEVAGRAAYRVERFVEKPSAERARELIATGLASWNAGIFVWTRRGIRERLARHAPEIDGPIRAILAGPPRRTVEDAAADLELAYPALRSTSIDYAVMEPASLDGAVGVVPVDVGWSDLGSWAALRDAWTAGATASTTPGAGNRRDIGSEGTLVLACDRLVVTIGLRDTIVVDTPEALLVVAAGRSQDVRQIAAEFAARPSPPAAQAGSPGQGTDQGSSEDGA